MAHKSPNDGDSQTQNNLNKLFHAYGLEPPEAYKNVSFSDTDDDNQSVDSEDVEEEESKHMLDVSLSSVNLEQIPEAVRASTMQQFLASSMVVALNSMASKFMGMTRAMADSMLARTNHMFDIFPENFKRSLRNAGRIFCMLLKYTILCSFVVRSVKYFYLNVYLD